MSTTPDPFHELDLAIADAAPYLDTVFGSDYAMRLRDSWKDAKAHHERLESLARRALEALDVEATGHPNIYENVALRADLREALKEKP